MMITGSVQAVLQCYFSASLSLSAGPEKLTRTQAGALCRAHGDVAHNVILAGVRLSQEPDGRVGELTPTTTPGPSAAAGARPPPPELGAMAPCDAGLVDAEAAVRLASA